MLVVLPALLLPEPQSAAVIDSLDTKSVSTTTEMAEMIEVVRATTGIPHSRTDYSSASDSVLSDGVGGEVGEIKAPQPELLVDAAPLSAETDEVPSSARTDAGTYVVTRVIDGDTIEVAIDGGRARVRYIGIDTPETVHPSQPIGCYGAEASARNKALVEGKRVRLERDISDTDHYDRLLRYVYVDDVFVNLSLVTEGYAHASTYPPDVKYTELFLAAQRAARASEKGLWGAVCAEPSVSKSATPVVSPITDPSASCVVKGNINLDDVRIYHLPGCQSYHQTVINEAAGERWFCSEAEALEAGWRKARNC